MDRRKQIFLLILLILVVLIINYRFLDGAVVRFFEERETGVVGRIIDGDTIIIGGESVRLLGINSPERGEDYYEEAKEFLEEMILEEEVELEINGKDKYYRTLAYVHLGNKNVNVELVESGFANYYFYSGKEKYADKLLNAWESCIRNNKNLCGKSLDKCANCISINSKSIMNNCNFDCDVGGWQIHSEGRKKFIFQGTLNAGGQKNFEIDLSNSGGSLFLRDEEGRLVRWENY